jgi:hypothetical protein
MLISELLAALSSFADAHWGASLCVHAQTVRITQLNQLVGKNIGRAHACTRARRRWFRDRRLLRVMRMMRVVVVAAMVMLVMRRVRKAGTRKQ